MSEPKRYYDFSHLLGSNKYLSDAERVCIIKKASEKEISDAMITSIINAFVIYGDRVYKNDQRRAREIAKEKDIIEVQTVLSSAPCLSDLSNHINYRLLSSPQCRPSYTMLFDFELLLINQKIQRLTSKKQSL